MQPVQYIKLSQLNDQIQDTINTRFKGQTYWVVADITNHSFKADKKIHYFELVEKSDKSSAITAKIMGKSWGSGALRILDFESSTGQRFTNNLHVLVQVSVDFHPLYGLSVNLLDIDSSFMLGILEQQRNATLQRLVKENDFIQKEGERYTTLNSRLKLPAVIQRAAVISSSSSAGNEDFRHTMHHNDFGYVFQIDDYHTVVQGDNNAKLFLNKLIEVYNTGIPYDVIVITRGGGSQSDFLIFDNYNIGRAVAKFPIPVITGIGHQKNVSITDLMAHTHTKTPTKAAEFIIAHNRSFELRILALQKNIVIKSQQLFLQYHNELNSLKNAVAHNARELISVQKEGLMLARQHIVQAGRSLLNDKKQQLLLTAQLTLQRPQGIIQQKNSNLQHLKANLKIFTSQYLRSRKLQLEDCRKTIKLLSPQHVLGRGYAVVRVHDKIINGAASIQEGQQIEILLKDALLKSTVNEKIHYDGKHTDL